MVETSSAVNSPAKEQSKDPGYRPLRVWPAVLLVVAMFLLRYVPNLIEDPSEAVFMAQMMGPLLCCFLILVWWLCFSRARWFERVVGLLGTAIALVVVSLVGHSSMMGIGTMFMTIPMGMAAFVLGTVLFRQTLSFRRTIVALLIATVGFGFSALLRNDGMWSDAKISFYWRWLPSAEDALLIQKKSEPKSEFEVPAETAKALADPEWSGFRGADRSSRHRGPVISSSWDETPKEIWKIAVGPGWSSFAVAGDLLFTQEQRGDFETVVCYDANTGKEIWLFEVKTRFEEAIGGAGPRGTPTLATVQSTSGGDSQCLFALGANGALVRLDPLTGKKIWQQELQTAADRKPPTWGFSSSPLVIGSKVIVHAGGAEDKGTLAFDAESGEMVWSAKSGDHSYSSPQLSNILDEDVVLMLSNRGLEILDPNDGSLRLDYEWTYQGYRSLQPQVIDGNSAILASGAGAGTRRVEFSKKDEAGGLSAKEVWTSQNLKPDFNDFVIFEGHLYGYDGSILTCIDLATGERVWKGGRYGKGQILLLENSGLILVASEKGEVVMLEATPTGHIELDRFQAIEGKTWNHPVVVADRLYIRNAEQAACYQLPVDSEDQ